MHSGTSYLRLFLGLESDDPPRPKPPPPRQLAQADLADEIECALLRDSCYTSISVQASMSNATRSTAGKSPIARSTACHSASRASSSQSRS